MPSMRNLVPTYLQPAQTPLTSYCLLYVSTIDFFNKYNRLFDIVVTLYYLAWFLMHKQFLDRKNGMGYR